MLGNRILDIVVIVLAGVLSIALFLISISLTTILFAIGKIDFEISRFIFGSFVGPILGAGVGAAGAYFAHTLLERKRRKSTASRIERSLYHELADRSARCLNDFIIPWREYRMQSPPNGIEIRRILKFRPADPIIYFNLAGEIGGSNSQTAAYLIHFYFRLDAVRRDIDRWAHGDPNQQISCADVQLMGQRIGETLEPALVALEALGQDLPDPCEIDKFASERYPHLARTHLSLRDALREYVAEFKKP